jgi:hypothetical protein
MLQCGMRKDFALSVLGPKPKDLARAIGVSRSAVQQWPDVLPRRIEDRVLAALARKHLPPELIGPSSDVEQSAHARLGSAGQEASHAP